MTPSPCPFCAPDSGRVFLQGQTVFALWDTFPVNAGHALIIPYRHVGSWFDATPEEQEETLRTIPLVRRQIEANHAPAGYNVGVTEDGTDQVGGQRIKGQRPTHRLAAARSDVGAPSTSRGPGPS